MSWKEKIPCNMKKRSICHQTGKLEQDSAEKIDELCFFMEKAVVLQSIRWIRAESILISLWGLNRLKIRLYH